jgi:hypothetical protein
MSQPMEIDFFVVLPGKAAGERLVEAARASGYRTKLWFDAESDTWTCNCSKTMLATYEGVVDSQRELQLLADPLGGAIDGWGTKGNLQPGATRVIAEE